MKRLILLFLVLASFNANALFLVSSDVKDWHGAVVQNKYDAQLQKGSCYSIVDSSRSFYASEYGTTNVRGVLYGTPDCDGYVISTNHYVKQAFTTDYQCPSGTEYNPDSHSCEPLIPECPSHQYWDESSNQCEDRCQSGQVWNEETQSCESGEPDESCAETEGLEKQFSNSVPLPKTLCLSGCLYQRIVSFEFETHSGIRYHSTNVGTGKSCTVGGDSGGTGVPDVDVPDSELPNTGHEPNDPSTDIEDPSVLPDGSNNRPSVDPDDAGTAPDVETPKPTPDSNGDVVDAITGLNQDVNQLLKDFHQDVNNDSADIQAELMALNSKAADNTQAIVDLHNAVKQQDKNTRSLITELNKDVTSAIETNTANLRAQTDILNRGINDINGNLNDIEGELASIGDAIDGITNTDTSGAGVSGTCIETGTCQSFYDSAYPEGIGGMFGDHFGEMGDTVSSTLDGMFELDLSNASRPNFGLPIPFYGTFYLDDYVNLDAIFSFIRIVMMITAAFACRKLIFGG